MAQITSSNDIQVLKIRQFLGLNENPDGDTKIKNGEMSKMRNFRVTREKHLQLRPGTKTVLNLKTAWDAWCAESGHTAPTENPVFSGAWEGVVDSKQRTLAAFGNNQGCGPVHAGPDLVLRLFQQGLSAERP